MAEQEENKIVPGVRISTFILPGSVTYSFQDVVS